jgi:hypothetical protein
MPRKARKGTPKKISASKANKKSPSSETKAKSNRDSLIGWLKKVNATKQQNFIYNSEIFEINSNSESDDCNLKELEVSLS